ncbi:MAG: right-handed parallel beta-helix repeat-containing protein, partial [Myxococcales bacterium]|nr:right-handed parallel beta-helix repeat-containing protein [Myxococcales bacterium]
MRSIPWRPLLLCALAFAGCDDDTSAPGDVLPEGCDLYLTADSGEELVQTTLIEAQSGQTVCFGEGTFAFTGEVSLSVDNVTLRGAGMDATVFDFTAQEFGANGVAITGDGVTVEDLQVLDAKGDGIRGQSVDGITFRRLKVWWTADASAESGAYGVYPVQSTNVRVEDCVVKGASDAGVYVGQSRTILVKGNEVFGNVAGIEIE